MNQHAFPIAQAAPFVDPRSLLDDPHRRFAALRSEHPVIRIGEEQYMVLRAENVLALLTDQRTFQVEGPDWVRLNRIPDGTMAGFLSDFFLFSNGEEHRKRRGLFARSFSHRTMRDTRERIRTVARAIVSELPRGETFDFVDAMAARIPAEMIAAILGLPQTEAPLFARLVYDVARGVTTIYPHEQHEAIEAAAKALFEYVEAHLASRLQVPQDDLLSELVTSWQGEQSISFDSLVFQVIGMIVGGSDTTRAAFAMLVALCLQDRDAWEAVRADPTLVPGAIAEAMRYEPSVGSIPRFATRTLDIDGIQVPPGTALSLSTLSALRDPGLYPDPDRFDIRREHPRLHPVFGSGPHRCIGEMLARIEMEEGLTALIARAPDIEMETPPRMIGFGGIRQITPMPVRIR